MTPSAEHIPTQRAVVITALPAEFTAVREHLDNIRTEIHPEGTVYEIGWLVSTSPGWEVSLVEIGKGNPRAAMETERAVQFFRPHVALFVGVAGGLKDVTLGDVVAGTKIYGYEFGKVANDFLPRPEVGNCSYVFRTDRQKRRQEFSLATANSSTRKWHTKRARGSDRCRGKGYRGDEIRTIRVHQQAIL